MQDGHGADTGYSGHEAPAGHFGGSHCFLRIIFFLRCEPDRTQASRTSIAAPRSLAVARLKFATDGTWPPSATVLCAERRREPSRNASLISPTTTCSTTGAAIGAASAMRSGCGGG